MGGVQRTNQAGAGGRQFDFDSLLLQIACSEVYSEAIHRHCQTHLTEADLDAIHGLDGLFRRYLDSRIETYRKLPDLEAAKLELARSASLQNDIWAAAVAGRLADIAVDRPIHGHMLAIG